MFLDRSKVAGVESISAILVKTSSTAEVFQHGSAGQLLLKFRKNFLQDLLCHSFPSRSQIY